LVSNGWQVVEQSKGFYQIEDWKQSAIIELIKTDQWLIIDFLSNKKPMILN
jgi:hypothetical protein